MMTPVTNGSACLGTCCGRDSSRHVAPQRGDGSTASLPDPCASGNDTTCETVCEDNSPRSEGSRDTAPQALQADTVSRSQECTLRRDGAPTPESAGSCCSPPPVGGSGVGLGPAGGCLPLPAPATIAPSCCPTATAFCCTQECAIAHAEYECSQSAKDNANGSDSSLDRFDAALEKYASMIQLALCLCRSVANSPLVRCCERRLPQTRVRRSHRDLGQRHAPNGLMSVQSDCCNETVQSPAASKGGSHVEASCKDTVATTPAAKHDPEAMTASEDVVLTVQGMTCTGCENKLAKSLRSIPGVMHANVVFVSGTASFRVDTDQISAKDAIDKAEKSTGFGLVRVRPGFEVLDILLPSTAAKAAVLRPPTGVIDAIHSGKQSIRVTYDPRAVGARALLQSFGDGARLMPYTDGTSLSREQKELRVLAINTALALLLAIPVCVLAWGDTHLPEKSRALASLVLATLVQLIAVREFYWKALTALIRTSSVELDMLVVISITAAFVYSVVAFAYTMVGQPLQTEGFFETSALLIALVLLGRLLAALARTRAVAAVSMRSLQEKTVIRIGHGGEQITTDVRLLQFGDVFYVPACSRAPTDGIVLSGISDVDESLLTGESAPVAKSAGSKIIAGTLNGEGPLSVLVDRLPGQNTIADIANLVELAQASKPRVQELTDVVAGYFVPVVLALSLVVFVTWILVSVRVRAQPAGSAAVEAITYTIAVLAVSCPCAIGLAVPMVLIICGGVAARRGVLIKSASTTERAWSITDIVFDKTGTLTKTELTVAHANVYSDDRQRVLEVTLALVGTNNHPVSQGVETYLSGQGIGGGDQIDKTRVIPGHGVQGLVGKTLVRAGSPRWLGVDTDERVTMYDSQNVSLLCVTMDGSLVAVFALAAELRDGVRETIRQLHARRLAVHLISGDAASPVATTANTLAIAQFRHRQSPADKDDYVQALMRDPARRVLFCGDGTNDAIAIARADVGVCMGNASDVTSGSASVTLLGSVDGILDLLDLSRAAHVRIVFNFVWSGVYNLFAILLASGALVVFRLPPAFAGLGELVSVIPVVVAAATILWVRPTSQRAARA